MPLPELFTALVTPFLPDGSVDFSAISALVENQIEQNIPALVLAGSTGEGITLHSAEKKKIYQHVRAIAGSSLTLFAGIQASSTESAYCEALEAKACGLDGILVVPPPYLRPNFTDCYNHFAALDVGLPVLFYYHPKRTGTTLSAKEIVQIAQMPHICGIKESSGQMDLAIQLQITSPKPLFSGDDILTLPHLAVGFHGAISVISNLYPREWGLAVQKNKKKISLESRAHFLHFFPLCHALSLDPNPLGIKFALSQTQGIAPHTFSPQCRLPLSTASQATKEQITTQMTLIEDIPWPKVHSIFGK